MTRIWISALALGLAGVLGCPSDDPDDDSAAADDDDTTAADDDTADDDDDDTADDCGSLGSFEEGLTPTTEIHVATDGDDHGGDGTAASPYATLSRAAQDAVAGAAIRLHAGTHAGGNTLYDLTGTAGAPIWLGGAPGEDRPVLEGGGEALHLVRATYVIVHDIEVRDSTDNGINCDDGGAYDDEDATHHIVFRDLLLHDVGNGGNEDCLKLSGLRDFWVHDSEIHHCGGGGSGSAVDCVGCHRGLIARNHLHDLSGNAVQAKGGTTDLEIRENHIVDAGDRGVNMGGNTDLTFFRPPVSDSAPNAEARDIRVVANVIEGCEASLAFVGCVDCQAVNNTIVDPENWIFRILQETVSDATYDFEPCRDAHVANNLIWFSDADLSVHINIGPNTSPETFAFTTNLWYAHDDPGVSQPDLPTPETGGLVGLDPAFTTGWQIDTSSPAAGAGTLWSGVVGDFSGACYAEPPSIGAYEAAAP
jgi:hypothetical protein